jgi:hypothetical protein
MKGNKFMTLIEIYWNIGSPCVLCHRKLIVAWGSAVAKWGRHISYSVFCCFVNICGREVFSGIYG